MLFTHFPSSAEDGPPSSSGAVPPALLFLAPLPRFQPSCPGSSAPVPTQKEGLVNNTRYNDKISVLLTSIFFPHLFVSICHSFLFLFCLPVCFCSVPQSSSSVLFVYLCLGFLVFSFFTSSHCLTIYIFFFCLYES